MVSVGKQNKRDAEVDTGTVFHGVLAGDASGARVAKHGVNACIQGAEKRKAQVQKHSCD